ncbi:MAG TPA: hypothetical protein VMY88_10775 [Acidimicrobiales bacterium]|nr:hypothetical protein [Acidimicrobiales bacterium]
MEVVARPPFDGTFRYLVRALRPKLGWIRLRPGQPSLSEDTDGPTVVLITDEGREIVLQRPGTLGQARRAASRFQQELSQVGPVEFTRRYGYRPDGGEGTG